MSGRLPDDGRQRTEDGGRIAKVQLAPSVLCRLSSVLRKQKPDRTAGLAQSAAQGAAVRRARLLHAGLGKITLERLVGFLGEVGVKLAELAAARHESLVGGLDEVGLDLDRLLQALGAEQLFGCRRRVLEGFLRVVRNLARDRLGALAERAELLEHDVHALAPELLEFIELQHGYPLAARRRSGARLCADPTGTASNGIYCTAQ